LKVLITGGTGNLARYCHDELRAHDHAVTLFDRFRPDQAARPWTTDASVVVGDLTSRDDCLRAVETARAEAIIHLGGIPYASESEGARRSAAAAGQHPIAVDATFKVNAVGTYFILEAARQFGTKTFVFASTASVLLETRSLANWVKTIPIDETHELRPTNSYSISKLLNEETLWLFGRDCGIRGVAFRMTWVYMPHHDADWSWNPRLPQPIHPPAPGELPIWQYVDARDAATAYRLALEANRPEVSGPLYLATDRFCVEEHRALVAEYLPRLCDQAERMGPDDLVISIRRARKLLGYVPRYSWRGEAAGESVW
jgi:nucleoside-diphosphate-sugar epimerase